MRTEAARTKRRLLINILALNQLALEAGSSEAPSIQLAWRDRSAKAKAGTPRALYTCKQLNKEGKLIRHWDSVPTASAENSAAGITVSTCSIYQAARKKRVLAGYRWELVAKPKQKKGN